MSSLRGRNLPLLRPPQIFLVLWLVFLSWAVQRKVAATEVPPVYDAIGYSQKAQTFWRDLGEHRVVNPFNIEPTVRGPGTILMSYPFGFSADFRGYYLRSTLYPIFLVVIAVYVAGYSTRMDSRRLWDLSLFSVFISTIPAFYHFEIKDRDFIGYWGLIDNYLTGIAAISSAAFVRSLRSRSLAWLLMAAFFSGLSLTIKPSGIMLMMAIGFGVIGTMLIDPAWTDGIDASNRPSRRLFGLVGAGAIWSVFVFLSFHSLYLSPENIAFGQRSMQVLSRNDLGIPVSASSLARPSVGYFFAAFVFVFVVFVYRTRSRWGYSMWSRPAVMACVAALLIDLFVGIWFWLVGTGITQVRYFLPFVLMATICFLPLIDLVFASGPAWVRIACWMLWMCPALNLALLLSHRVPSPQWQEVSGMNINSGAYQPQVRQATELLQDAQARGVSSIVYSLEVNSEAAVLLSIGAYSAQVKPSEPSFSVIFPIDWQRTSTFRLNELMSANYLFFCSAKGSEEERPVAKAVVRDFAEETLAMRALMSTATRENGVRILTEGPGRLVEITDKPRFQQFLLNRMHSYQWDPAFLDANSAILRGRDP